MADVSLISEAQLFAVVTDAVSTIYSPFSDVDSRKKAHEVFRWSNAKSVCIFVILIYCLLVYLFGLR